jgi:hypothetical protein
MLPIALGFFEANTAAQNHGKKPTNMKISSLLNLSACYRPVGQSEISLPLCRMDSVTHYIFEIVWRKQSKPLSRMICEGDIFSPHRRSWTESRFTSWPTNCGNPEIQVALALLATFTKLW